MSAASPSSPLPVVAAPTVATRVPGSSPACPRRELRRHQCGASRATRRPAAPVGTGPFSIADGMGGYEGGGSPARSSSRRCSRCTSACAPTPMPPFPGASIAKKTLEENLLVAAIRLANRAIIARRVGPLRDMGSTVVAMVLSERSVVLAHVGDSRIYRLRGASSRR